MDGIEWELHLIDDGFLGIVSMVVSAIVIALVIFCALQSYDKRRQAMWGFLSIGLFALAVNKQLDLHNLLRDILRSVATAQGWMDSARALQLVFIILLALTILVGGMIAVFFFRRVLVEHQVLFIGVFIYSCMIFFEASAFHHVNPLLALADSWVADTIEIFALILIGIDATHFIWHQIEPRPNNPYTELRNREWAQMMRDA